jgi:putative addiction module component (TIGR02574 family)
MNSTEQVFDAALALPEGERVELVEALIASLQPADRPPFDEAWREVIRRRSNELRSGQVTPVPWAAVTGRVREEGSDE